MNKTIIPRIVKCINCNEIPEIHFIPFLRYGKQYYRLSIEHTCWKTNEGLLRKKYEGSVTGQQSKIREIIKAIKKWNNANDKNSTFD